MFWERFYSTLHRTAGLDYLTGIFQVPERAAIEFLVAAVPHTLKNDPGMDFFLTVAGVPF